MSCTVRYWLRIRSEMDNLNEMVIPKVINVSGAQVEIHGFSDSSMHAYGACVYVRGMFDGGSFNVHLLCSKVKVSLKKIEYSPAGTLWRPFASTAG